MPVIGSLSPTIKLQIALMMTSAQVVEASVTVTNNSPSRDYSHPDNQTTQATVLFLFPYISYRSSGENLFEYQQNLT